MKISFLKLIIGFSLLLMATIPAISSAQQTEAPTQAKPWFCYQWTQDLYSKSSLYTKAYKTIGNNVCFYTMAECSAASKEAEAQFSGLRGVWNDNGQKTIIFPCVKVTNQKNLADITPTEVNYNQVCEVGADFSLEACLKIGFSWIVSVILWLLSWVLWLASQLFNASLKISITNFSHLANSAAVNFIWSLGRDIANIFFLFVLMYIAIATIIQKSGINTQKLVVELIITALLINFSIIIPRVVIDIGNSLANVFYQNMGPADRNGDPDVSSVLVQGISPQKFFKGELAAISIDGSTPNSQVEKTSAAAQKLDWSVLFLKGLGTGFMILVLSYALFVAAYMFLARTVVLIFLIATSSLAFFTRIIPSNLKLNYWNSWFGALIKEVVYAPYFLFVFYLVLRLSTFPIPGITAPIETSSATGGAGIGLLAQTTGATSPVDSGGIAMQVAWYFVLCGLAVGSVIIAKKASSWSQKVVGAAGKYGGKQIAGFAGRHTVGRAGAAMAKSDWMQKSQARIPGLGKLSPIVGGAMMAGAKKMGDVGGWQKKTQAYTAQNQALQTPELKLQHLSNLSGQAQLETYGKMDAKTRSDMFKAAQKLSDAGNNRPMEMLSRLRGQDASRLVTGHGAEAGLQDEQFAKQNNEDDRIKYLMGSTITDEDISRLYKSLSPEDRIKMENRLLSTGATAMHAKIVAARAKFDSNPAEKDKMDRAGQKIERMSKADAMAKDPTTNTIDPAVIRSLSGADMIELLNDHLDIHTTAGADILRHLTKAQLAAISISPSVTQDIRNEIKNKVQDEVTTYPGNAEANRSLIWMNANQF